MNLNQHTTANLPRLPINGRSVNPAGMWGTVMPREYRMRLADQRPEEQPGRHQHFGERIRKIFIGRNVGRVALRACLLDERLASSDSNTRAELRNPFPELRVAEESV